MIVQVFHFDRETTENVHVANVTVPIERLEYEITEVRACEYAWTVTQNLAGSWSRGPVFDDGTINCDYTPFIEVVAPLPTHLGRVYGHRSSDVGDLFIVNGATYKCAMVGFEKIENSTFA